MPEPDVLANGGIEEEVLLEHDSELRAPRALLQRAQIGAVDHDDPLRRVFESQQQRHQRALAGAAVTEDAGEAAGGNAQVDPIEQRLALPGHGHVDELEAAGKTPARARDPGRSAVLPRCARK